MLNDDQLMRYSRHILLPGLDEDGQERICQATALIVGAGGLGCPAAMYLAASGIGRLILIDHDHVDVSNLQRQIAHHDQDVDAAKVLSLESAIKEINPGVEVDAYTEKLDEAKLLNLLPSVSVVLDCSDNFTTRAMVNRLCVQANIPLVSGAAIAAQAQLMVVVPEQKSACYHCVYGKMQEDENSCVTSGVLAPLVGVVGSYQALEALKLVAKFGEPAINRLQLFDAALGQWRDIGIKPDTACDVCGA